MIRHRLQFFRTATRNIDPAAQVTRLKCWHDTFSDYRIANVVLIFGKIFAIQVLVIKYLELWNVIHWRASLLCAHWRTRTFPGKVPMVVPRLRAVFWIEFHRNRKYHPYWSEQVTARSRITNIHSIQVHLRVPSGSFGHLSLSARNKR
jgi:hypothetical protein